jgi:hypothetical protein
LVGVPSFGIKVGSYFRVIRSNSISLLIPEFNGSDYDYWCIDMMTFLIRKDLWEIVEMGYAKPGDWTTLNDRVAKKEFRKKNAQALFHIQIALDKNLFPRIVGAKPVIKSKLSCYRH